MTVLAVDAGGTHVRLALADSQGRLAQQTRLRADLARHGARTSAQAQAHVLEALAGACASMLEQHPDITAIGIGFPGFFIADSGVLAASPNIPMLHDFPLAERLSGQLGIPVCAHNDGLLAALGEFRFGAGRQASSLLHVTLGTGVGGGLILDGRPYTGESGMAMEIGHLCVIADGRPCGCGGRGCLETYASAGAIAARYHEAGGADLDAAEIHARAADGDALAGQILQEAGFYLGRAIGECSKLLDIRLVTVSGGLTGAWDMLYPHIRSGLEQRLIPPQRGNIHLRKTALNDDAGLLGAASMALAAS